MIKYEGADWIIFFFGYRFFYYDFLKFVKKSLLVDQLTFVAIKKIYNDVYLKMIQSTP